LVFPAGIVNVPLLLNVVERLYSSAVVIELDAEDAVDVPFAFVAVTVYVLAPSEVSVTLIGDDPAVPVAPLVDVAVNTDTAFPPVAPAVNGTDTVPVVPLAVPIVGAAGTVVAVIAAEALDAGPVPAALVPVTVKV
jgi:hypothetical protein